MWLPSIGVTMSTVGVCLSVAILIIVTSVMNGFREELLSKILGFNAHITIQAKYENYIKNYTDIVEKLNKIKGVKSATPVVIGYGMIANNNGQTASMVKGMRYEDILIRKEIYNSINVNWNNFQNNEFSIILGADIKSRLGSKIGSQVNLLTPIIMKTIFGMVPRIKTLEVIGTLNTGAQQYDAGTVLIPFVAAQKIYNLENGASEIEILTDSPYYMFEVKKEIMQNIDTNLLTISDWKLHNKPLIDAMKVEATVMSLILGMFVIIAMFAVFTIISMMITEKEREIAILRAHGVSSVDVIKIFIITGSIMTLCGIILGNIIGITLALNIETIRLFLEQMFQMKILDNSIYFLSNLPSKLMQKDIILIDLLATITASIACIVPSIKAGRKEVQEILRAF